MSAWLRHITGDPALRLIRWCWAQGDRLAARHTW